MKLVLLVSRRLAFPSRGWTSLLLEMVRDYSGESLQSLIAFAQRSVDGGGEVR